MDIVSVHKESTGGGFYTYYGQLKDGNYFMYPTDWIDIVVILDVDPESDFWDELQFEEGITEHLVKELTRYEAIKFIQKIKERYDYENM